VRGHSQQQTNKGGYCKNNGSKTKAFNYAGDLSYNYIVNKS